MTDNARADFGPSAKIILYNLEVEESLLGCVLINPDSFHEVADFFKADWFHLHKHRWVWDVYVYLDREQIPIDLLTVNNELTRKHQMDEIGGFAYLTHLINIVPTSLHIEAYARIVQRNALRRRTLETASAIAKLAYDEEMPADELLAAVEGAAFALRESQPLNDMRPMVEIMGEVYDALNEALNHPELAEGFKTGFPDLDKLLGGLYKGDMTLLTGDPGSGKSMLAMQICENLARQNRAGAVFELEMKTITVARRMVSAHAQVKMRGLRDGILADADFPVVIQAINALSDLPIWMSGATSWTTTSIRATLMRMTREIDLQWALVDYLDLLADDIPGRQNEYARDTLMARNLHSIAKDLNLHLIVIHTLTKEGFRESSKKLQNVSGSAKVSYAADNVLFLGEHVPENGRLAQPNLRTVQAGKLRNEEITGSVDLAKVSGFPMFVGVQTVSLEGV